MAARLPFRTGAEVEMSSDEDGFRGAWYEARVVRFMPKLARYTVEYDSIVDDADESRLLRETVAAAHLRPRPPRPCAARGERFAIHHPVDAYHNDGWWAGIVSEVRGEKYAVSFPSTREEFEYRTSEVRAHLEWVDGQWIEPDLEETAETIFNVGAQVEVAQIGQSSIVCWFPATIVKTLWKNNFLVEYEGLPNDSKELQSEIVGFQHIRPCPKMLNVQNFDMLDEVEAFYGDAWWSGVITRKGPFYFVKSKHWVEEKEFSRANLRLRYDWVYGQWIQAPRPRKKLEMEFKAGSLVEVSSEDEGFRGAWFAATVIKSHRKNLKKRFLVEYINLRTDDDTELLKETVDYLHIRPTPPETPVVATFNLLEEVDAFYNDGWWIGVVSKILEGSKYMVYFKPWKEEMEFRHEQLRFHYDWIDGRWLRASQALEL